MTAQLFFPQHFSRTRPYCKAFMERVGQTTGAGKMTPQVGTSLAADAVLEALTQGKMRLDDPRVDMTGVSIEMQAAVSYAEWVNQGSVLYQFDDDLTAALLASTSGDVTLNDLHFPFRAMYFHFGNQTGARLRSGAVVTGAYLLYAAVGMRVGLTAPLPADAPWTQRHAELYDLRIDAAHFGKGLEEAIAAALDDDIRDIQHAITQLQRQPDFRPQALAAAENLLRNHDANRAAYTCCLNLIANAVCYLTAFPEDAREQWQTDTPARLREQTDAVLPKQRARAASKLNAMGYRTVRYVGRDFTTAHGHAGVAPHWRRGHWRRQRHGAQLGEVKLIWLRPTRVLGGAIQEEPRVYGTNLPR